MDANLKKRGLVSQVLCKGSKDYALMTQILAYLGERWQDHPDYKMLAKQAGLSPAHFHKIFTRWAGVSPKRYVNALAHNAAKEILGAGGTIEDATYEVGKSAPSRLHDLFVRFEALSPGEAKSRAAGVNMVWGVADCPFGKAMALISPRGLSAYGFFDEGGEQDTFVDFYNRYPDANYIRDDEKVRALTAAIFAGGVVPIALYGTEFQIQVWQALLRVGSGQTVRYMDVAKSIDRPRAVRAVGAAIGANPISWVIPCHRILGADRRLTGYHWGVERKRAMLAFENIRANNSVLK